MHILDKYDMTPEGKKLDGSCENLARIALVIVVSWFPNYDLSLASHQFLLIFNLFGPCFPLLKKLEVPFEEVPDLVAKRKVFVQKGNAYFSMNQVSILHAN